jgi:hypothetical protein
MSHLSGPLLADPLRPREGGPARGRREMRKLHPGSQKTQGAADIVWN